jgi:hypothetical protein
MENRGILDRDGVIKTRDYPSGWEVNPSLPSLVIREETPNPKSQVIDELWISRCPIVLDL